MAALPQLHSRAAQSEPATAFGPAAARGQSVTQACALCPSRKAGLCDALDDRQVAQMSAAARRVRLEPGMDLFYEGDDAAQMYTLLAGTVTLYRLLPDGRRHVVTFAFPGDMIGLGAHGSYRYGATALDVVQLCAVPQRAVDGLAEQLPRLGRRVADLAVDELSAAQDHLLLLARKTAPERMASFLVKLWSRIGRDGRDGKAVLLPMGRTDIADYLGLTVETVSRVLTQFRKAGLIDLRGPSVVVIHDLDRLGDIASGEGDEA